MSAVARRALLLGVLALALVSAGVGTAQANSITPSCQSPPFTGLFDDCSGWHIADVRLTWDWEPKTETAFSGCNTSTVTSDTQGAQRNCHVEWGGLQLDATVTIKVDKTAPTVVAATPERPPDHGGWYNRPVTFSFVGSDATSGLESCSPATYGGPDGAVALVTGECRDIAGNSGVGSFPLSYDATPPWLSDLAATPADASAKLSWRSSPDTVTNEVIRTPGDNGAPSMKVFGGTSATFTDLGLVNGVTYTYTVTAHDQAGNTASGAVKATPAATSLLQGTVNVRVKSAPLLRWKRVRRARYYNLQVLRGHRKVLSVWPKRTRYQMRESWTFRGRRYRLARGRYRWYVWPGYGSRAARRYGKLVGKGSFNYAP